MIERPKLGQHFLRDPRVVQTILEAAELGPADTALEIGPGKGVLTQPLVQRAGRLVAVELDRALAPRLQAHYAALPHVRIVQGDFLKTNLDELFPDPLPEGIKVLGNLPYAITAPIFEKILAWPGWSTGVFLVQREVGERMRSAPGSKTFGILSLAIQLFAEVEVIAKVKPGAFTPPPRVMSMVIRLRRRKSLPLPEGDIPAFFDLAHAAFSHRRKTLANSLSLFADVPKRHVEAWLSEHQVRAHARAESLELADYAHLANPWAIFRRRKRVDLK